MADATSPQSETRNEGTRHDVEEPQPADAQDVIRKAIRNHDDSAWIAEAVVQWLKRAGYVIVATESHALEQAVLDAACNWADDWDDDQWCEQIDDVDSRLLAAVRALREAR